MLKGPDRVSWDCKTVRDIANDKRCEQDGVLKTIDLRDKIHVAGKHDIDADEYWCFIS